MPKRTREQQPPILGHMRKKRPCGVCRKWFRPDARVGDKQKVCSAEACQKKRRQKTQAQWRARNPSYFTARRLQERHAQHQEGEGVEVGRMPPPLDRLPWDVAQDVFGFQGADFLGEFGRLVVGGGQDAMPA